jgi:hypothetical protein
MSQLTYYRLTAISIGISILNSLAIAPVVARESVAIVDRSPRLGLDIGLEPIVPLKSAKKAIKPKMVRESVAIVDRSPGLGLDIGLEPIVPLKSVQRGCSKG